MLNRPAEQRGTAESCFLLIGLSLRMVPFQYMQSLDQLLYNNNIKILISVALKWQSLHVNCAIMCDMMHTFQPMRTEYSLWPYT